MGVLHPIRRLTHDMTDRTHSETAIAELLADKRDEILRLAARYKAYNVRVFGSVVRGEATPDSDIDFLVEFEPDYKLTDHVRLIADLEQLLGRHVDVAAEANLKEGLRPYILREAIPLTESDLYRPAVEVFVRDEKVYLHDILEHIGYIEEDTKAGREHFLTSRIAQNSVTRSFEVIGEVVKRLKPETIRPYPDVKWSDLAKFRDFLIHHYERVEPERLWEYVESDLPPLKGAVTTILDDLESNPT